MEDGVILYVKVAFNDIISQLEVKDISYVPTQVKRGTFEIIPIMYDNKDIHLPTSEASKQRTKEALESGG